MHLIDNMSYVRTKNILLFSVLNPNTTGCILLSSIVSQASEVK